MGGFNCQIDVRQLKELQKKLEKLRDKSDPFMDKCVKNLSARLLRKVIKRTPVGNYSGEEYECNGEGMHFHHKGRKIDGKVGGELRKGWTASVQNESESNSDQEVDINKYVNSLEIVHSGNMASTTISNPVEYAPYVEHGHRVVVTGKDGKKKTVGYVQGHHMLEKSVQDVQKVAPKVVEKLVNTYFRRGMR